MQEFIELTVGLPFQDAALLLDFACTPIARAGGRHERIADQPPPLFQDLPAELLADAITTIPVHVDPIPFAAPSCRCANYLPPATGILYVAVHTRPAFLN
jgi:hypothetical protein